jgi:hypothetical protein
VKKNESQAKLKEELVRQESRIVLGRNETTSSIQQLDQTIISEIESETAKTLRI